MKTILLCAVISMSAACIDQLDPAPADDVDAIPRLSSNGMNQAQIQLTNLDQAALTATAVAPYTTTIDGRAYLSYLVGCALDGTQSITSGGYTYTGSLGITTGWTSGAITLSQRRWISACLLARTNSLSTAITISMRATHPSLYTTEGNFNLQEGTFYGDLFSGNNIRRACADSDTLTNSDTGKLKYRICARDYYDSGPGGSTGCGFVYDGACSTMCTLSAPNYTSCTDLNGTTWNE